MGPGWGRGRPAGRPGKPKGGVRGIPRQRVAAEWLKKMLNRVLGIQYLDL
jgi:hypothetical protein